MDRFEAATKRAYIYVRSAWGKLIIVKRLWAFGKRYYTNAPLYFTLLYFTLLYFTLLYFTLLYFTLLYFTLLYFTLLYFTLLYFTLLYFTLLPFSYNRGGQNFLVYFVFNFCSKLLVFLNVSLWPAFNFQFAKVLN